MQRTQSILQKLQQFAAQPSPHVLDIDMMLDEVRNLYAELLEQRTMLMQQPAAPVEPVALPIEPVVLNTIEEKQEVAKDIRSSEAAEWPAIPEHKPAERVSYSPDKPINMYGEPLKDIRSLISINDKYQFISELFRNDKEVYEETLNEINACQTEEQAIETINFSIVDAYNWNENDYTVQMFYKLLNDFFARR